MLLAPEVPANALFKFTPPLLQALSDALPDTAMRLQIPMSRDQDPSFTADALTIGLSLNGPINKHYQCGPDGLWSKVRSEPSVWQWNFADVHLPDFKSLATLLMFLGLIKQTCLIRAAVHPDHRLCHGLPRRWHQGVRHGNDGKTGSLIDLPRTWLVVDIDDVSLPAEHSYDDPGAIIRWVVRQVLPAPFQDRSCVWQFSGSAGLKTAQDASSRDRLVKLHLFFRAHEPIGCRDYHALLKAAKFHMIDRACAVGPQPIYTAAPSLEDGADPLACRQGIFYGQCDEVDLSCELAALRKAPQQVATPTRKRATTQRARDRRPRTGLAAADTRPRTVVPYKNLWLSILYNDLGSHADGYRNPIFRMVCAAIANGERNFPTLKADLRKAVQFRLHDLNDAHKRADVARYLSDGDLDEAITNALDYVEE